MTKKQKEDIEWDLYDKTDGTDQRIFMVNPYQFARHTYTLYIDSDQIVRKSAGLDREEKVLAFNMLTDPRVAPFTDQKEVVDEFVIEQFTDDPERFKKKGNPDEMMNGMMSGMMGPSGGPALSAQAGKVEPPKVLA
jgi:hypothetical protein